MKFNIPNIYTSKNLKFFAAIPIIMMLVGLYLSQYIVLDSSLSGGVSIILQSTSNLSAEQIASSLGTALHVPNPTVQVGGGQVQVTIAANKSLSDAENYLIGIYQYNGNYSTAQVNYTNYNIALQSDPSNQTLRSLMTAAAAQENASYAGMQKYLNLELSVLSPFNTGQTYNATSASAMISAAQSAYSNASNTYKAQVMEAIGKVVPYTSYSYEQITVQQSSFFLQQLQNIIIWAFILISIVVFFIFRTAVPSFAVVFGAANDIIVALGAMALFRIPLGIASIGGLLMLLGYSIDTDVLTAIRIIKRHEGTLEERAYSSMKTGLTMTSTAIVSFAVLFAVSIIAYVPTYYEISGVVLFGLIGDLFTTWLGNASMILLYMKHKGKG